MSTTNSLSSGLIVGDEGGHQFSEGEMLTTIRESECVVMLMDMWMVTCFSKLKVLSQLVRAFIKSQQHVDEKFNDGSAHFSVSATAETWDA